MKKILTLIVAVGLFIAGNAISANAGVDWDDLPTDQMPVVEMSGVDWDDLPTDQMPVIEMGGVDWDDLPTDQMPV